MRFSKALKTSLRLSPLCLLFTSNAWACEVCYGAAESPMLEGMSASIFFLLATTYFVIVGIGLTFFISRRRARHVRPEAASGEGA